MKFSELNIIPPLLKAIDKAGFDTPTEIQEKVIPSAISWSDILWIAQTGSWKTLAFCLPILQSLYNKRLEEGLVEWKVKRKIKSLIIAPTRELAIQIWENFSPYCTNTNFKHTVIYWWINDFHQIKTIEKWVDILIATPWRLEDLIWQWVVKLSYVEILVLDEADRMLDMWFLWDIQKVIKRIPENKQILFFSATMPKEINQLALDLLKNPLEVKVNETSSTTENINQKYYFLKKSYKRQLLQYIVKKSEYNSIIVFVKTKDDTQSVLEYVKSSWVTADNIHRNRSQNARQRAINSLKEWKIKVLVATDVASRWIDINDLSCVINYNIPNDPETYVHRIWRTARAGKSWVAISFCTEEDKDSFENIEKLIWKKIEKIEDENYKNEVISKTKILWYFNFEEDLKEKYKKKTRKSVWKKYYWNKKKSKW